MKINNGEIINEIPFRVRCSDWREDNAPIRIHARMPLMQMSSRSVGDRDYLRRLRAAEMAAWERSGGDYLMSCSAARM